MLAGVAICGAPWLVHRNAGEVRIGPLTRDQTSHVQPDQSLYLMQMYADGRKVHVQDAPRIIIETSASESRCHIINKVFKYLYETEYAVHAVIVCDMQTYHLEGTGAHPAGRSRLRLPFGFVKNLGFQLRTIHVMNAMVEINTTLTRLMVSYSLPVKGVSQLGRLMRTVG
ncbi:hypothetical protein ACGC1H_006371 [Rhizoctonia solani]